MHPPTRSALRKAGTPSRAASLCARFKFDGETEELQLETMDGYAAELQYFADCVNEARQPLICSPRDSANAVYLAHELLASRAAAGARRTLSFPC